MASAISIDIFFLFSYSLKMWVHIRIHIGTTHTSATTVTAFTSCMVSDLRSAQNYWNISLITHPKRKISPNSPSHLFHFSLGSWAMDSIPNCTKGITLKTSLKEQEQTLDVKGFTREAGLNSCFPMQGKQ